MLAGQAVSEPASYPAPPPGVFPDFNHFTTSDIAAYTKTNWHHDTYIAFKTSGGVTCFSYIYGQTTGVDGLGLIECTSRNMPGFPENAGGQQGRGTTPGERSIQSVRENSDGSFEFAYTNAEAVSDDPPVLPAGKRLVVNNSGCGAGDDFVACYTAYHHGFVVSPTGSWAF